MWAHHPSAWTNPRSAPDLTNGVSNNNNTNSSGSTVVINEQRQKKLTNRRKRIIKVTAKRLEKSEHKKAYLQFAKMWYENREEAIRMFETESIPVTDIRSSIWELCSRSCELLEQSPGVYMELLTKVPRDEKLLENILLDIERTLPCTEIFDEKRVHSMKNILIAYTIKDPVIGYSQGMNYLAATIIFLLPEENAFWLMMRLMKGYSLEKLYPSPYSELNECLDKFGILLKIYMPEVHKQLQDLGAELHYYVPQWFQTIFLYTQRVDLSIRVLDMLIIHGIQALFRVGLAIISLARGALMSDDMSLVVAIEILKNLNLSVLTTKEIMHVALSFPNNLLIQTINSELTEENANAANAECTIS